MAGMAELEYADVLARFTWNGSRLLTGCGSCDIAGLAGKSFFNVGCFKHLFPKSSALFSLLEKSESILQIIKALE